MGDFERAIENFGQITNEAAAEYIKNRVGNFTEEQKSDFLEFFISEVNEENYSALIDTNAAVVDYTPAINLAYDEFTMQHGINVGEGLAIPVQSEEQLATQSAESLGEGMLGQSREQIVAQKQPDTEKLDQLVEYKNLLNDLERKVGHNETLALFSENSILALNSDNPNYSVINPILQRIVDNPASYETKKIEYKDNIISYNEGLTEEAIRYIQDFSNAYDECLSKIGGKTKDFDDIDYPYDKLVPDPSFSNLERNLRCTLNEARDSCISKIRNVIDAIKNYSEGGFADGSLSVLDEYINIDISAAITEPVAIASLTDFNSKINAVYSLIGFSAADHLEVRMSGFSKEEKCELLDSLNCNAIASSYDPIHDVDFAVDQFLLQKAQASVESVSTVSDDLSVVLTELSKNSEYGRRVLDNAGISPLDLLSPSADRNDLSNRIEKSKLETPLTEPATEPIGPDPTAPIEPTEPIESTELTTEPDLMEVDLTEFNPSWSTQPATTQPPTTQPPTTQPPTTQPPTTQPPTTQPPTTQPPTTQPPTTQPAATEPVSTEPMGPDPTEPIEPTEPVGPDPTVPIELTEPIAASPAPTELTVTGPIPTTPTATGPDPTAPIEPTEPTVTGPTFPSFSSNPISSSNDSSMSKPESNSNSDVKVALGAAAMATSAIGTMIYSNKKDEEVVGEEKQEMEELLPESKAGKNDISLEEIKTKVDKNILF